MTQIHEQQFQLLVKGTATAPPAVADFAVQFSTQNPSPDGWSYRAQNGALMTWDAPNNRWKGPLQFQCIGSGFAHPGSTSSALIRWTSPTTINRRVLVEAHDQHVGMGDGVRVLLRHRGVVIHTLVIPEGQVTPLRFESVLAFAAGETFEVEVTAGAGTNMSFDTTGLVIRLTETMEVPTAPVQVEIQVGVDQGPVHTKVAGALSSFYTMADGGPSDANYLPLKIKMHRGIHGGVHEHNDVPLARGPIHARFTAAGAISQYFMQSQWYAFRNAAGRPPDELPGDNGHWTTWENYCTHIVTTEQAAGRVHQYEPWNEPNLSQYWPRPQAQWFELWKRAYQRIKAVLPSATMVGPAMAGYTSADLTWMSQFLDYAKANSVVPDILAWHEIPHVAPSVPWLVGQHITAVRALLTAKALPQLPISINEWGHIKDEERPGVCITFLAQLEQAGVVSAARSCWVTSDTTESCGHPTLDGYLTASGGRRAGWWVAEAYANRTGRFVNVFPTAALLYGSAAWDVTTRQLAAILGNPRTTAVASSVVRVTGLPPGPASVTLDKLPFTPNALGGWTAVSGPTALTIPPSGTVDLTLPVVGALEAIRLRLTGTPPDPTPPGELTIGAPELLALADQRPWRWPDGGIGIVPGSWEGTEPFSYFAACGGKSIKRVQGPLSQPTKRYTNLDLPLAGVPTQFGYVGGGQIWRIAPTCWLMWVHVEVHAHPSGFPFRSAIGAMRSTDEGRTWTWIGEVLRPQVGYALPFTESFDVGGGATVFHGTTVRMYFRDQAATGAPMIYSVASAPRAAVEAWALGTGPQPTFLKWHNGTFSGEGLGGPSSNLPWVDGYSFRDIKWSSTLGKYLALTPMWVSDPARPEGHRVNLHLDESTDGITWARRAMLGPSAGYQDYYPTMIGADGNGDDVRSDFFVYYVQDPHLGANGLQLYRRRVTIGSGPPPDPLPPQGLLAKILGPVRARPATITDPVEADLETVADSRWASFVLGSTAPWIGECWYDRISAAYHHHARTPRPDILAMARRLVQGYVNETPGVYNAIPRALTGDYTTYQVLAPWNLAPRGLAIAALDPDDAATRAAGRKGIACLAWIGRENSLKTRWNDPRESGHALSAMVLAKAVGATPLTEFPLPSWQTDAYLLTGLNLTLAAQRPEGWWQTIWNNPSGVRETPIYMQGLQLEALCDYYDYVAQDPRILPAILRCATWLQGLYQASSPINHSNKLGGGGWWYSVGPDGAVYNGGIYPNLSAILLYAFGWLWQRTGNAAWKTLGEQAFRAQVAQDRHGAPMGTDKWCNQSFRHAGRWLAWRAT